MTNPTVIDQLQEETIQFIKETVCCSFENFEDSCDLYGLTDEHAKLFSYLNEVVANHHSLSVVLSGYHGSGKMLLLRNVLSKISSPFRAVWVDGLVYSDDESAFEEIAGQLSESDVDRESARHRSAYQNLSFISEAAKLSTVNGTPVLFILSHFERFAHERRTAAQGEESIRLLSRQSLLYVLLDMLQDPSMCVGIVGLTTKLNASDSFEKRLKSRFTALEVDVPVPSPAHVILALADSLTIPLDSSSKSTGKIEYPSDLNWQMIEEWNRNVAELFDSDNASADSEQTCLADDIHRWMNWSHSFQWFQRVFETAVLLGVTASDPQLTAAMVRRSADSLSFEPELTLIAELPLLQQLLLFAAARLEGRKKRRYTFSGTCSASALQPSSTPTSPPTDLYAEYSKLKWLSEAGVGVEGQAACSDAFRSLRKTGLLLAAPGNTTEEVRLGAEAELILEGLRSGKLQCAEQIVSGHSARPVPAD